MEHEGLTGSIIGAAMKVHRVLGPGFLESVYKNALAYELTKRGLAFQRDVRIRVYYEDFIAGEFEADMLVESCVVVECKATRALVDRDETQLVNYLVATRKEIGILLNFGSDRLQFKRKTRTFKPSSSRTEPNSDNSRNSRQDWQDWQDHKSGTAVDSPSDSSTREQENRKKN